MLTGEDLQIRSVQNWFEFWLQLRTEVGAPLCPCIIHIHPLCLAKGVVNNKTTRENYSDAMPKTRQTGKTRQTPAEQTTAEQAAAEDVAPQEPLSDPERSLAD